jgi:integrase/recombinase XerD
MAKSMRGRKIVVGETSVTLYARHKKTCPEKADNSGTVNCKCIRWMQHKDGKRQSTGQWVWTKAEEEARRLIAQREGVVASPPKVGTYSIERAIDEWVAERDSEGLHNAKAIHIGKKLLAWCRESGIENLGQIQKQALRVWRTEKWKYRTGDSCSLKCHWSVLSSFFNWCVDGDLLEANPCPRWKGRIKQRRVVPLTPAQIDATEAAVEKMQAHGWTDERRLKMRTLIQLMRWSGMAIRDAVCLPRADVWGQLIKSERHKTGKRFSVPLPEWLVNLLVALPNDDPGYFFWFRCTDGRNQKENSIVALYGNWFKQVFEAAGIRGHSHQLRHSFATHHLARGVRVERVAEWMGDSPAEVRRTYEHWVDERTEMSEQAMRESWAAMGLDSVGNPITDGAPTNKPRVQ